MSNPEQIRQDIERTRANLSEDVNALAENANPRNIAEEQVDKARQGVQQKVQSAKEAVFGSEDDFADDGLAGQARQGADQARAAAAGGVGQAQYSAQLRANQAQTAAGQTGQGLRQQVQDAPGQLKRRTRGNPLAAGLVAFGLGALVGGALPSTKVEKRHAEQAKEQAQPLLDQAQDVARDTAASLKEPAQDVAQSVKGKAQKAAENVKGEAAFAKQDLTEQAQSGKQQVQQEAKQAKDQVSDN